MESFLNDKKNSISIPCTFKSIENKHYSPIQVSPPIFGNELKAEQLYQISLQIFQLHHSLKIKAELHVPTIDCEPVNRIHPIPLEQNALVNFLTGPGNETCRTGFISMSKTRKLILYLDRDTARFEIPLIGVWMSGVDHIKDVKIITSIARFIYNQNYQKNLQPMNHNKESFLLLTFDEEGKCQYYDCPISLPQESNTQIWYSSSEIHAKKKSSIWMEWELKKKSPILKQEWNEVEEQVVFQPPIKTKGSPFRDRSITPSVVVDYNRHSNRVSMESSFSHYHPTLPMYQHHYPNLIYPTQPTTTQPTIVYMQQPQPHNTTTTASSSSSQEQGLLIKLIQEQTEMIRELSYQCREMKTEIVQLKMNQKNLEQSMIQWNQKQQQHSIFEQSNLLPMNDSLLLQPHQPIKSTSIPLEDSLLYITASSNGKRMHQPIVTTTAVSNTATLRQPTIPSTQPISFPSTQSISFPSRQQESQIQPEPIVLQPQQQQQQQISHRQTQPEPILPQQQEPQKQQQQQRSWETESKSIPSSGMEEKMTKPVQPNFRMQKRMEFPRLYLNLYHLLMNLLPLLIFLI